MNADLVTLRALKERVDSASGPDRELDVFIYGLIAAVDAPWSIADVESAAIYPYWTSNRPPYTASIDAAVALIERVMPGFGPQILRDALDYLFDAVIGPVTCDRIAREAVSHFLTALIAKGETDVG